MAIHPTIPGLSITLRSNKTRLTEHAAPAQALTQDMGGSHLPKTATTYIECIAECEFEFHLRVDGDFKWDCPMLSFYFVMNGREGGLGQLYGRTPEFLDEHGIWECRVPGLELSDEHGTIQLRRFVFTALKSNFSDQDDDEDMMAHLDAEEKHFLKQNIGTLEVQVYRVRSCRRKRRRGRARRDSQPEFEEDQLRNVQEAELKKLLAGRSISLGADLKAAEDLEEESPRSEIEPLDSWDEPMAVYRFHYRTKEDLKSELIIPRTPSTSPSPFPRKAENVQQQHLSPSFDDFPLDEIEALARIAFARRELERRRRARKSGKAAEFRAGIFESLEAREVREMARMEFEGVDGVKPEVTIKPESEPRAQSHTTILRQKRSRRETRVEYGRICIELSDDESDADNNEDDEVVVVDTRRVRRARRGEEGTSGGKKVKRERVADGNDEGGHEVGGNAGDGDANASGNANRNQNKPLKRLVRGLKVRAERGR